MTDDNNWCVLGHLNNYHNDLEYCHYKQLSCWTSVTRYLKNSLSFNSARRSQHLFSFLFQLTPRGKTTGFRWNKRNHSNLDMHSKTNITDREQTLLYFLHSISIHINKETLWCSQLVLRPPKPCRCLIMSVNSQN